MNSSQLIDLIKDTKGGIVLKDVIEVQDGFPVRITRRDFFSFLRDGDENKMYLCLTNEGGCCHTAVDLLQLLYFIKDNHPELWSEA